MIAALSAAAIGFTGVAHAKVAWNFNMFGPKRAMTAGIEKIKELVEKDTNGELAINIQYGGALGNRKQNPESIKSGVFEAGQICVGYYPSK